MRRASPGQLSFDLRECLFCASLFTPTRRQTQAFCSRRCQQGSRKTKPEAIALVQQLRAEGKTFKQISQESGLSVGSVHLYAKGVSNDDHL